MGSDVEEFKPGIRCPEAELARGRLRFGDPGELDGFLGSLLGVCKSPSPDAGRPGVEALSLDCLTRRAVSAGLCWIESRSKSDSARSSAFRLTCHQTALAQSQASTLTE
jgi:hypothetical protein